jgi:hypothetical protein
MVDDLELESAAGERMLVEGVPHIFDAEAGEWVPEKDPLDVAKEAAIEQVKAFADDVAARLTAAYPKAEVDSWTEKKLQARALLAGEITAAEAILLSKEAEMLQAVNPDLTVEALAQAVLDKASFYEAAVGTIAGMRGAVTARIQAASNVEEVRAVMVTAKEQADQILAGMGVNE